MLVKIKPMVIECVPSTPVPPVIYYALTESPPETVGMVRERFALELSSKGQLVEVVTSEDYTQWNDGTGEARTTIVRRPD